MIFYINKLKKIVVGRNNQTATQIINIDFQTIGEISFSFIDDRNKILPIEDGQYYFAGKKDTLLFFTEDFKIENNILTFKVDTYTEPFLNAITKRNTEIEVEIGFKNETAKNVCLRDYAFAQPRVYIDSLPPGNIALPEYYTKTEIDALFSEVGVDLSDYTGENVSIKVNNNFKAESNKNLSLRAYPADKGNLESCYIDMYGQDFDGYGQIAIQSKILNARHNQLNLTAQNNPGFEDSCLNIDKFKLIKINAPKANIGQQLTVEGDTINFSNQVNFNSYANFNQDVYFSTPQGYSAKAKIRTQYNTKNDFEVWIECNFREQYDTFWSCTDPLLNLYIQYVGGNHIVQFEVMTQEDLDMEPGDGFGFELTIDDPSLADKININKPFNFEPGKKYMIIFQQEESTYPINIFWTELTDYVN